MDPNYSQDINQTSGFLTLRKKLLFLATVIVLVLTFVSFYLFKPQSGINKAQEIVKITPVIQAPTVINEENKKQIAKPAPKVYFRNYENKSNNNASPFLKNNPFSYYDLETNFKDEQILAFGGKFGLNEIDVSGKRTVILYNSKSLDNKGVLNFDRTTGAFSYQSFGILKPKNYSPSQSVISEAESFLKDLGNFSETITCANTYQIKGMPEYITFVECHRNWEKTKVPIINLGGVLNLAEDKKLADLNVGIPDENAPIDTDIINVKKKNAFGNLIPNSREENLSRPNGFNTITLGIAKDGRILSVESNLRWIKEANLVNIKKDLLTVNEALEIFKSHKYKYALTLPAGTGILDLEKVYPQNLAVGTNAVINEILLIFLEKPVDIAQETYEPYYLIRGTAPLDTGYNVKFVELIPALRNKQTAMVFTTKEVAGFSVSERRNLQLDTFNPSSLISSPAPSGVPKLQKQCKEKLYGKELSLNIPSYGVLNIVISGSGGGFGHTFYYKSTTLQDTSLQSIKKLFFTGVKEQYMINVAQWIKDHNSTVKINNTEDVEKLFYEINQLDEHNMPTSLRPAPIILARRKDDIEAQRLVYKQVIEGILEAEKNNKINEIAARADLFPEETIAAFDAVFIDIMKGAPPNLRQMMSCYLSGVSPVIYLYPVQKTKISVKVDTSLVYADPSVTQNIWNVTAYPGGLIEQNGIERQSLYYEYDKSKVSFNEPKEGFIVKTSKWKEFVKNNLSQKLGLNIKETESLITEINNTIPDSSDSPYLKLSLIPQSELDKKLPLIISPKSDNIYRINVFVKPVSSNLPNWTNLSNLPDIKRNGFTVVELGAYSD